MAWTYLMVPASEMRAEWAPRSVAYALVQLHSTELRAILGEGLTEDALLPLLRAGTQSRQELMRALHISERTLDRRLRELRARYGARSTAELVGMLRTADDAVAGARQ